MSVNLSKHSAMATSALPEETAQAASRKATSPVADAFSMCVTGQPGESELLHGLDAEHRGGLDVSHEGLVDVGEGHARIVEREQPGVPGQVRTGDVLEHAEADHADAGHGHVVELEAVLHAAPPVDAVPAGRVPAVGGWAGRKR